MANPTDSLFKGPLAEFAGVPIARAARTLSRPAQWRLFIICLAATDGLMIALAFWLAYVSRFRLTVAIFQLDVIPSASFYLTVTLVLVPLWLGVMAASSLYNRRNLLGGTLEYSLIFRATSTAMLLVVIASFLEPTLILARGWLLLAWLFAFLLLGAGRFCLRRVVYNLRTHGYFLAPALIIGANQEGRSLAEQLLGWRTSGLLVLGFVDDRTAPGTSVHDHLLVLGNVSNLDRLVSEFGIEELILATSALSRDEMVEIFTRYGLKEGLNLRLSSGLFEIITTGLEIRELAYVPLVRVNKVRLTGLDRVLKLILDYSITVPVLILSFPWLGLIALAIKLSSPGPIIHRRRVMGVNGRQFDAFKFRTMAVNGDEVLTGYPELQAELAQAYKLKEDPRITPVGRLLRQLSLDELPQLLNVLRREMSLVGPRMISPPEMAMYNHLGMNLLTVRPGITGKWQVSGRSDISYEERVRLDMQYIRNWTIWLDLQVLLQTLPAVLTRRGAY